MSNCTNIDWNYTREFQRGVSVLSHITYQALNYDCSSRVECSASVTNFFLLCSKSLRQNDIGTVCKSIKKLLWGDFVFAEFFSSLCSEEKSHCCRLSNAAPSTDFHSNKHIFTTHRVRRSVTKSKRERASIRLLVLVIIWLWNFHIFHISCPYSTCLFYFFASSLSSARVFHTFDEAMELMLPGRMRRADFPRKYLYIAWVCVSRCDTNIFLLLCKHEKRIKVGRRRKEKGKKAQKKSVRMVCRHTQWEKNHHHLFFLPLIFGRAGWKKYVLYTDKLRLQFFSSLLDSPPYTRLYEISLLCVTKLSCCCFRHRSSYAVCFLSTTESVVKCEKKNKMFTCEREVPSASLRMYHFSQINLDTSGVESKQNAAVNFFLFSFWLLHSLAGNLNIYEYFGVIFRE